LQVSPLKKKSESQKLPEKLVDTRHPSDVSILFDDKSNTRAERDRLLFEGAEVIMVLDFHVENSERPFFFRDVCSLNLR